MLQNYFYHERIRKSVAIFGSLFNEIYVLRKDGSGKVIDTIRVPLSYAPREAFLDRIRENPDLNDDTKVAVKLPRMSFEIISFQYDPSRKVGKTNNYVVAGTDVNNRSKIYSPVPYIISMQLNIYAKTQDDALQIVEQIMPYFNPQYSLTIKPFSDYTNIKEDIPINLEAISYTDTYERVLGDRRMIMYQLDFTMLANFYGPINEGKIIRKVENNFYFIGGDSDTLDATLTVEPNPLDANPDSDYGFSTTITTY